MPFGRNGERVAKTPLFSRPPSLGDGVVGEVKLADDTPDAGLNHSNDKDEAKAAGSKSSVDEDYKAISRKAGNPPVINTKEGKELTDGIHRMWQSITGNKGK